MGADAAWDMVVIGGGTAGIVAARAAVRLGARTLLVESESPGGDCLFTGCVPSKALIAAARAAHAARTSVHLGVSGSPHVDFAAVMRHVHGAIDRIAPSDSVETLEASGIHVMAGRGRFTDASTLSVDGRDVSFDRALVATGASAALPAMPGSSGLLTSATFWRLEHLPQRMLVIGGGPVGCEIGQAMARLGSRVTIVQRGPRLLPAEDSRASSVVLDALVADGVRVLVESEVIALGDGFAEVRGATGRSERIDFDEALLATGREPRTAGLGLGSVGVQTDAGGAVVVDRTLRTTHPQIWAAGDVTALPRFTHTASANAEVAVTNALTGSAIEVDDVVARVTYTSPEVAAVGESTAADAAGSRGSASAVRRVLTFDHSDLDRGIVDGETAGFTSIIVDSSGVVRGATVVGPRAGDTLGELALAVRLGVTTDQLAGTTHAYPGYGYAVRKLALQDVRARASRV